MSHSFIFTLVFCLFLASVAGLAGSYIAFTQTCRWCFSNVPCVKALMRCTRVAQVLAVGLFAIVLADGPVLAIFAAAGVLAHHLWRTARPARMRDLLENAPVALWLAIALNLAFSQYFVFVTQPIVGIDLLLPVTASMGAILMARHLDFRRWQETYY